jgi:hypothetical protein
MGSRPFGQTGLPNRRLSHFFLATLTVEERCRRRCGISKIHAYIFKCKCCLFHSCNKFKYFSPPVNKVIAQNINKKYIISFNSSGKNVFRCEINFWSLRFFSDVVNICCANWFFLHQFSVILLLSVCPPARMVSINYRKYPQ